MRYFLLSNYSVVICPVYCSHFISQQLKEDANNLTDNIGQKLSAKYPEQINSAQLSLKNNKTKIDAIDCKNAEKLVVMAFAEAQQLHKSLQE